MTFYYLRYSINVLKEIVHVALCVDVCNFFFTLGTYRGGSRACGWFPMLAHHNKAQGAPVLDPYGPERGCPLSSSTDWWAWLGGMTPSTTVETPARVRWVVAAPIKAQPGQCQYRKTARFASHPVSSANETKLRYFFILSSLSNGSNSHWAFLIHLTTFYIVFRYNIST